MPNTFSPPIASEHVLYASATALIDAPIDKVWAVLTDLPAYREWNAFVPSIVVTDSKRNTLVDQTLTEGKNIYITINTTLSLSEPYKGGGAPAVVSAFDPDNYRVSWKAVMLSRYVLSAVRWQVLSVDEETGKTKYETHETFDGLFAYYVKWALRGKIERGFHVVAEALKERAEELKYLHVPR